MTIFIIFNQIQSKFLIRIQKKSLTVKYKKNCGSNLILQFKKGKKIGNIKIRLFIIRIVNIQ